MLKSLVVSASSEQFAALAKLWKPVYPDYNALLYWFADHPPERPCDLIRTPDRESPQTRWGVCRDSRVTIKLPESAADKLGALYERYGLRKGNRTTI